MSNKLESIENKIKRLQKQKREMLKKKEFEELKNFKENNEKFVDMIDVLKEASNGDDSKLENIIKEIVEKYSK